MAMETSSHVVLGERLPGPRAETAICIQYTGLIYVVRIYSQEGLHLQDKGLSWRMELGRLTQPDL